MKGKWGLHHFYLRDPEIGKLLPPTAWFNRKALEQFLRRYGSAYVKPNTKHMGMGIIKVWKTKNDYCLVRVKGTPLRFRTIRALYAYIGRFAQAGGYIIQKAVPLAEVSGRPYDIRVMMMRGGSGHWQCAGMLAKVAGRGSVITNVARGSGYVLTVEQALRHSLGYTKEQTVRLKQQLRSYSTMICRRSERLKYSSQIGIDIGVDRIGKISIIEVNFDFPSHALFARLKDRTMFYRVKRTRSQFLAYRRRAGRRR